MTLQQLVGISLPVIQAPMAGSQGSALAVAVSNAGGLGSLPGSLLGLDRLREELAAIRAGTDRPYNVNFFCHVPPEHDAGREAIWRAALGPYYAELGIDPGTIPAAPARMPFSHEAADVLEEFKPAVVSFHFGLPEAGLLARVRGWGAKILSTATTVEEALWLEAHGVDAIIAQGIEAGGHRGIFLGEDLSTQAGTFDLVARILKVSRLPVIAAGGISRAEDVGAALAMGAAGVQVGTAYLLCPEATTSPVHRAALLARKENASLLTALTNVFTGRPARGIVNRIMREVGPMSALAPEFPLAATAMGPLRAEAVSLGSGDFSPLWAGENAGGCREISAGELTRELGGETSWPLDPA